MVDNINTYLEPEQEDLIRLRSLRKVDPTIGKYLTRIYNKNAGNQDYLGINSLRAGLLAWEGLKIEGDSSFPFYSEELIHSSYDELRNIPCGELIRHIESSLETTPKTREALSANFLRLFRERGPIYAGECLLTGAMVALISKKQNERDFRKGFEEFFRFFGESI